MAAVSWSYPQDELIALRAAENERRRAAPVASGITYAALNFAYRIKGDKVPWRPVRVFDDGRQLFVEFGESIATGEMPPLFVLGDKGAAELVNYRVDGRFMIVDRLFERGELRLGAGRNARHVRIERDAPRRRSGK
jgi:type IV secretion system protein VirB9